MNRRHPMLARALTLASMLIAAAGCSVSTSVERDPDPREDAAAVRALDARWANTYATHDMTLAREIMSDDFVMTSTNGGMKDRATELRDVAGDASSTLHYFRSADVDVRVHGDAAVVTGRLEWSSTYNGSTNDVARRYTATWVRGGPLGWRMVALHVGRVPEN